MLRDQFLHVCSRNLALFLKELIPTSLTEMATLADQFREARFDKASSLTKVEIRKLSGPDVSSELEIKDTTESTTSASYLDLLLSIGRDGQLHTSIYDKRDDFNFHITNFPFLSSNIPSSPRPMACLSLNLYDTPGLAPRMNVLF